MSDSLYLITFFFVNGNVVEDINVAIVFRNYIKHNKKINANKEGYN